MLSLMLLLLFSAAVLSFMTVAYFVQHRSLQAENTQREMQCLCKCH